MASRGDSRINELLARLASGLSLLLEIPPFEGLFRSEVSILLDRISAIQQQPENPELMRLLWNDLSRYLQEFLARAPLPAVPPSLLRIIADEVGGRHGFYFVTPPASAQDVTSAFYEVLSEGGHILEGFRWQAAAASAAPAYSAASADYMAQEAAAPPPAPEPSPPTGEIKVEPPRRVVNTGFSNRGEPERVMPAAEPLKLARAYWFWLEIGEVLAGSIEDSPTPLPESVPTNAVLSVALFSFPGELILDDHASVGTVRIDGTGASVVIDQPGIFEYLFPASSTRQSRLFFPVSTPSTPGPHRLRCNIYYQHVLVQSRIVTAHVANTPERGRALRSTLDFKLSHTLDPARLARMGANTLSVFINDNRDGTHGFYFEGEQSVKMQATLDADSLQDSITQVRRTLRTVAWGSPDPWQDSSPYRYAGSGEPAFFKDDLVQLAIRGYLLYNALIDGISGSAENSDKLAALMLKPGRVQISSKESARFVVPAALFYDRPLDTQARHQVCDTFLDAVRSRAPLAESACFQGQCPHLNELDIVCPGGFWGYRHEVGFPVSIERAGIGESEPDIQFKDPAAMVVIVSLDKMFVERESHEKELRTIRNPLGFTVCDERSAALKAMQNPNAQLIYFYCHGGITANNTPFLNIGNNEAITPDNLRAYKIHWSSPRPLVFLNGCMTTALEPEKAIEFVSAFVNQAAASGVIGTEITIFEPLATKFGQTFMSCFMGQCKPVGQSIRLARLALLEQFNPLGLVYIPFALPGLRMVDLAGSTQL